MTNRPRDEVLDDSGRLRGPWRRVLGTLLGLGTATLHERQADLDRAFADEGASAILPGTGSAPQVGQWRCDPIPFLFTETEFATLAARLTQRADLLEALLADVYGPRSLLADGTLPPSLVYPSPRYLRTCRGAYPRRHLHLYAADLIRGPDGDWRVLADRTDEPAGLGYALENRRMMARVLPEMFRSMEVAQLRPFFDAWQTTLQRLTPPGLAGSPETMHGPGTALLSPGHADPRWFEHVVLARELGCTLVEPGDLTVRDGALWVKTLRGLLPIHVLLRRQGGAAMDPLELHATSGAGIPGLFTTMRSGAVLVLNAPGSGYAESPGLAPLLPLLCRRLLGADLQLPSVESHWLGDPMSRALVEASLSSWTFHAALDGRASAERIPTSTAAQTALLAQIAEHPFAFTAMRRPTLSVAPCASTGDTLVPRPIVLRLFLMHDGTQWRALPGGIARIVPEAEAIPSRLPPQAISKDVWVLLEEGADIMGPGNLNVPSLQVRRTAGDMPSRVADNFFWFGRYLERLENAARLTRAMLARLSRAGLLPRDLPELRALSACLAEADVFSEEVTNTAGATILTEALLRALTRDNGALAYLTTRIQSLADNLRDRLSGEMYTMVSHGVRGLKGARLALRGGRPHSHSPGANAPGSNTPGSNSSAAGLAPSASLGVLTDFAQRVLEFSAATSGYAAENMVRGGGRLFLDLGRRIERAHAIATQLAHALNQPPERIEAGLMLALELCDSQLTYRGRYLGVVQPALVLDLVLADTGNPRGLSFQLREAQAILRVLDDQSETPLAAQLDAPLAELDAIIAGLIATADQPTAAASLPPRLQDIAAHISALSDALRRQYFTLLPVTWTESVT